MFVSLHVKRIRSRNFAYLLCTLLPNGIADMKIMMVINVLLNILSFYCAHNNYILILPDKRIKIESPFKRGQPYKQG